MRWKTRHTVEDYLRLDVRTMARKISFVTGNAGMWGWYTDGKQKASISYRMEPGAIRLMYKADKEPMDYCVRLVHSPCHYGGSRPWFLCPAVGCGRRVATLFGGKVFACRHCHRLAYESQVCSKGDRDLNRSWKLRARLGCRFGYMDMPAEYVGKPKHMHQRTFEGLVVRLKRYDAGAEANFIDGYERIMRRCRAHGIE